MERNALGPYVVLLHDDTPGWKETLERSFDTLEEAREFVYDYNKTHVGTNWSAWMRKESD